MIDKMTRKGEEENPLSGTWHDGEVIREINIPDESLPIQSDLKPYSDSDLVAQYEFFRRSIYDPVRVFYPSCGLDISPLRGFPNSEVVLMDIDNELEAIMKAEGVAQFITGDVLQYKPERPFDLVIALNPTLDSKDLTRHLVNRGYVLANNWHNNASELLETPNFEGIGTIDRNESGIYLARKDFSKLEPEQFETLLYVFRKVGN